MSRFLFLFAFMLIGAGLFGAVFSAPLGTNWGLLAGGLAGALVWLVREDRQGRRLLDWLSALKKTPVSDAAAIASPARLSFFWREFAEHAERVLRLHHRALQKQRLRTENLIDALQATPNGIIMLDARRRIQWMNTFACLHFALDAERDIGQSITHLLRDPVFVAGLVRQEFCKPILLTSPCSTPRQPMRLSLQLCPYGKNRLLLLSQEITHIEKAEAGQRAFIANVSHELRTPLTVLAGFIETLQTLPLDEEERQDYLARMERQALQMQTLVADLLTLSCLEESPPPDFTQWSPIRGLLTVCAAEARAFAGLIAKNAQAKAHQIHFPADAGLGEIAGNARELQSAFSNLVHNAIRHTPPGSRVDVYWQHNEDGSATLTVQDNGPGIAPEHLSRLTERFYRVDPGRSRESGGTGLGLSIVKHVLQRHGAALEIDSAPGQGARFSATFPKSGIRH
ncbi:MAG: phosphate regulon sensor histidine kinase PhoR [Zoogloeaceae bacterium]|jgi:two-component system phosphate regulon sensor histidine kinase PhoR|nr:phosphate regulon sensor histidine kinase PhoR [Zoogloeaceae bacterium]